MTRAVPFLALLFGATAATAQKPADAPPAGSAAAPALVSTDSAASTRGLSDSLRDLVARVRRDPAGIHVPSTDSLTVGDLVIPAGTRRVGDVSVVGGTLDVAGTLEGNALAIGGDVIVRPGGHVTGDAVAAMGRVRADGGTVDGELKSLEGAIGAVPRSTVATTLSPAAATRHAVSLALSWLAVIALIGIGILVFAGGYLDGVVEALEESFSRSLWIGIGAQLALAPLLLLLIVALALTIIGALLIPFAIVAYVLAVAGLVTLGFLAVARVTGDAIGSSAARRLSLRGAALRALVVGISIFLGLWVLAGAFTWLPIASFALRAIALGVTWVAATAGLGAALLSRAGTRRTTRAVEPPAHEEPLAWQTPTPISGVVAARRPASAKGRGS